MGEEIISLLPPSHHRTTKQGLMLSLLPNGNKLSRHVAALPLPAPSNKRNGSQSNHKWLAAAALSLFPLCSAGQTRLLTPTWQAKRQAAGCHIFFPTPPAGPKANGVEQFCYFSSNPMENQCSFTWFLTESSHLCQNCG